MSCNSAVSGCDCSVRLSTITRILVVFFFNDTATTEIYTLSLHDALPISSAGGSCGGAPSPHPRQRGEHLVADADAVREDRKSTRLNSSHSQISYAVFCLKKKKQNRKKTITKVK